MQLIAVALRAGFLVVWIWTRDIKSLTTTEKRKAYQASTVEINKHVGSTKDIMKHDKEKEELTEDDLKDEIEDDEKLFELLKDYNEKDVNFDTRPILKNYTDYNKNQCHDYREMEMDIETLRTLKNHTDKNADQHRLRKRVYRRHYCFPGDGDNKLHRVTIPRHRRALLRSKIHPNKNVYSLYTRKNPTTGQILVDNDTETVKKSNFKAKKVTVFIVHGWKGSSNNNMSRNLTNAFLYNDDVNVIVLDWNYLAKGGYWSAREGTPYVGAYLGKFILWLQKFFRLSLDRVHLVGFSLGAHLVGSAGRQLKGQVKRITGLDPAGYLWRGVLRGGRLDKDAARYVEVIHTNGGSTFSGHAGYPYPLGHSDHYPNGGSSQPGCGVLGVICSHSRAYLLMAATVKYNHLHAKQCERLKHAHEDTCNMSEHPMGNADLNKNQSGIFRVNTASKYPF